MNSWYLKSTPITVARVAEVSGYEQHAIRNMLLSGAFGPPPPSSSSDRLNFWQIAQLFSLLEAARAHIPQDRMNLAMASFAGATYVRLALTQLQKGGWHVGRGSPERSAHLLTRCKSDEGPFLIEQQLPLAGVRTRRFACFSLSSEVVSSCDSLEELDELPVVWPLTLLDSWNVARRIQHSLPGTYFTADFALAA